MIPSGADAVVSEALWQLAYFAFVVAVIGVPIVAIRALLRKMRSGRISKLMGFVIYGVVALSPTALYALLFFSLVGIEEMTGAALIPEGIARTFLIVVGFGLLVWLLALLSFAVVAARANIPEKHE